MSKIIASCKDIIKTFNSGEAEVKALQGITLDVYGNELLMLVGPSGCGKTTFVSVLSGLLSFDSGVCKLMGENISAMNDDELTRFRGKNIGFVFQAFNLLPSLSAIENVALPLTVASRKRAEALALASEMLEAVGLSGKEDVKPSGLSGGEQQKVAIARALVHNPKFIICDEPTSSLDHKSGQIVMELLTKIIQEKGASMIVVTHDNRIYKYANRIVHMEDGKITKVAL